MTDTVIISVPDMTCGHCEKTIRDALSAIDSNAQIEIDLAAQVVKTTVPAGDAMAAIVDAGYSPIIAPSQ